jgi:hypothetical protein
MDGIMVGCTCRFGCMRADYGITAFDRVIC